MAATNSSVSLTFPLKDGSSSLPTACIRASYGQAHWLQSFWIASAKRKHESAEIQLFLGSESSYPILTIEDCSRDKEYWEKQVTSVLKKVVVEDLGNLQSRELWDTIPVEDPHGRGRTDLQNIEKLLTVKVVFCSQHVLLVGAKAKLAKKCSILRNFLAHYYWRLSGKEVHL